MDGWHKQWPIRDNTYASASLLFLGSICHFLRTAVIISPFSPTPFPVANFFRVVGGKTIIFEIPDEKGCVLPLLQALPNERFCRTAKRHNSLYIPEPFPLASALGLCPWCSLVGWQNQKASGGLCEGLKGWLYNQRLLLTYDETQNTL